MAGNEAERVSVGQVATDRLDQQIHALAKDTVEFESRPDIQVRAVQLLQGKWKPLTPDARGALLATYSPIFPRCYEDSFPEKCLADIIILPNSGDVHRALRVRKEMYTQYQPDLHEDIYPTEGWFGRFLNYSKHNIVPTPMYFWAALAVLGVACRRNFLYAGHNKNYRLSNYVLLTGPKGTGKSDAREAAIDILERANRKVVELEEANDRRVVDVKTFTIPILGEDVTAASLVEKLAGHCKQKRLLVGPTGAHLPAIPGDSLAIVDSDELGVFVGKDSHAAGTMIPMLVKMAYAESYRKSTKKGGEENADRLALSILACTAPEWMHNTVVGDAMSGGFLDRVLLIHREPTGRFWTRRDIPLMDPILAEQLADWLVELMLRVTDGDPMLLTPKAGDRCDAWELAINAGGRRDASDASKHSLPRMSLHLVKIASLLCIAEWDLDGPVPWVQEAHIDKAIQLLEVEEEYREEFMAQAEASADEPGMQRMLKFLRDNEGEVSKTQFNAYRKFRKVDHTKREYMIAGLVARGDIIITRKMAANNKMAEFYTIPKER